MSRNSATDAFAWLLPKLNWLVTSTLDDADFTLVQRRRGDHNRLGFALQLCTVRFLGTFLTDPTDVPSAVVTYLGGQLGISDLGCLPRYLERPVTHWEHASEIQRRYGYRDFSAQPEHWRLVRWLYERAWVSAERPSILFDLATALLVERKVLLPGVTVLARLVASVRERAGKRLWRVLAHLPNTLVQRRLEGLLFLTGDSRQTRLDKLRRAPTRQSSRALVEALNRLIEVRGLGVGQLDVSVVPPSRLKILARTIVLKEQVTALLPRIDLPEALLEVQARTGFADEFTHISEGNARVEDLSISICAVLLAEACNIGLEPLVRPDVPALTRGRLAWVQLSLYWSGNHHTG